MFALYAIYKAPENSTEFDAHYEEIHTPLVKTMDGLRKLELSRFTKMLTPPTSTVAETPYIMCTMYFEDQAALENALRSPGGKAAGKDLMGFAGPLVSMITAEVQDIAL